MIISENIEAIDCHYGGPEKTSAYLITQGDRAAFVDTNTNHAVPLLLAALERRGIPRGNVDYIIVTHVHLDHAGGAAALADACPNAQVIAHPKAARHLAAPERLIASSKLVYGEEQFHQLYGEILPLPADRITSVEDESRLVWRDHHLRFLHTAGHATHHICIHDEATNTIFTGDTFGIGRSSRERPGIPFLIYSSSPTEFDAPAARVSLARILETGATTACIGHFGAFDDLELGARQLMRVLGLYEGIQHAAADSGLQGEPLRDFCIDAMRSSLETFLRWCGVQGVASDLEWIGGDIALNGMGLAIAAERERKKGTPQN